MEIDGLAGLFRYLAGLQCSVRNGSNDHRELKEAIELVKWVHLDLSSNAGRFFVFYDDAGAQFTTRAEDLDVYAFCMCEGDSGYSPPADLLSQLRAYARDGRCGALVLRKAGIDALVCNFRGLRIDRRGARVS
jgi:hypothetical protein